MLYGNWSVCTFLCKHRLHSSGRWVGQALHSHLTEKRELRYKMGTGQDTEQASDNDGKSMCLLLLFLSSTDVISFRIKKLKFLQNDCYLKSSAFFVCTISTGKKGGLIHLK